MRALIAVLILSGCAPPAALSTPPVPQVIAASRACEADGNPSGKPRVTHECEHRWGWKQHPRACELDGDPSGRIMDTLKCPRLWGWKRHY